MQNMPTFMIFPANPFQKREGKGGRYFLDNNTSLTHQYQLFCLTKMICGGIASWKFQFLTARNRAVLGIVACKEVVLLQVGHTSFHCLSGFFLLFVYTL